MSKKRFDLIEDFVFKYSDNVQAGFKDRWDKVDLDIYDNQFHECIGALLARQASLTIEMAHAPSTWNGSVGPLFLRCMIDAYITIAWILDKPKVRSEKFVLYGLGQEKLYLEHLEKAIEEDPDSHDVNSMKKMVELRKSWLNSQLYEWATEVNVGSWSGISTREMAKQIGRETIYNYAYAPFSGAAHNMWQHVGIYNLEQCQNPMHKFHNVPIITNPDPHVDFMYRSSKYMTITFDVFDEKMGIKSDIQLPMDFLISHQLFDKKPEVDN